MGDEKGPLDRALAEMRANDSPAHQPHSDNWKPVPPPPPRNNTFWAFVLVASLGTGIYFVSKMPGGGSISSTRSSPGREYSKQDQIDALSDQVYFLKQDLERCRNSN